MKRSLCGKARVQVWIGGAVVLIVCLLCITPLVTRRREPSHIDVKQMAQFNTLHAAIELYANEFEGYPPSDANDLTGVPYCGAMRLTEAMKGQDLLGFHSLSVYRADGMDVNGRAPLYCRDSREPDPDNLKLRRGPYLRAESTDAFRLADIYGKDNTGPFPGDTFVLCDVFECQRPSGKKTGMPILYYRANPSGTAHDGDNPDNPENIYRYMDNQVLIALGVPGEPNQVHPLSDPRCFYRRTKNTKNKKVAEPYRRDTFILISAGYDGLYGTKDDICNFGLDLSRRR